MAQTRTVSALAVASSPGKSAPFSRLFSSLLFIAVSLTLAVRPTTVATNGSQEVGTFDGTASGVTAAGQAMVSKAVFKKAADSTAMLALQHSALDAGAIAKLGPAFKSAAEERQKQTVELDKQIKEAQDKLTALRAQEQKTIESLLDLIKKPKPEIKAGFQGALDEMNTALKDGGPMDLAKQQVTQIMGEIEGHENFLLSLHTSQNGDASLTSLQTSTEEKQQTVDAEKPKENSKSPQPSTDKPQTVNADSNK